MLPDCSEFQSQSVQICRYVFHHRNGPNQEQTLKIQWFLLNEICTDTNSLHYCDSLRKFCWNLVVKILNWECLFGHRKQQLFLSVHVDDINMAVKKHNMVPMWNKLMKNVAFEDPTSFVDLVLLGCTQRECNGIIVIQYRKMFDSRISAGGTEKLPGCEKPHAITVACSYDVEGHPLKCVERCCELANKKVEQWYQVSSPCLDDHHFKNEEFDCSRIHKSKPKQKWNRDVGQLWHVDYVTTNTNSSQGESQLYIFEDNEAVIKMIIQGRSPTMRHVSRTHRVALDRLFQRINLDPKIQIKYFDTKNQLADLLTKDNFTCDEWNHLLRSTWCFFFFFQFSVKQKAECHVQETSRKFFERGVGSGSEKSQIGSKLCFIPRQETDAKHQPKPNNVFSSDETSSSARARKLERGEDIRFGKSTENYMELMENFWVRAEYCPRTHVIGDSSEDPERLASSKHGTRKVWRSNRLHVKFNDIEWTQRGNSEIYFKFWTPRELREEILARTQDIPRPWRRKEMVWSSQLYTWKKMGFNHDTNGGTIQRDESSNIQKASVLRVVDFWKRRLAETPYTSLRMRQTQNSYFERLTQQISPVNTEQSPVDALKNGKPQEENSLVRTPRSDDPVLRQMSSELPTLKKEIQFTQVSTMRLSHKESLFNVLLHRCGRRWLWRSNSSMQRVFTHSCWFRFKNLCRNRRTNHNWTISSSSYSTVSCHLWNWNSISIHDNARSKLLGSDMPRKESLRGDYISEIQDAIPRVKNYFWKDPLKKKVNFVLQSWTNPASRKLMRCRPEFRRIQCTIQKKLFF